MALNGLFYADVLRSLDLVPITDFTYKYRPGWRGRTRPIVHGAIWPNRDETPGLDRLSEMHFKVSVLSGHLLGEFPLSKVSSSPNPNDRL